MMNNKLDDYINDHPQESLRILVMAFFLIWQSMAAVFGLLLYFILIRILEMPRVWLLLAGIIVLLAAIYFHTGHWPSASGLRFFLKDGFVLNKIFWREMFSNHPIRAMVFILFEGFNYIIGLPLLVASLLGLIDLVDNHAHKNEMKSLQKGECDWVHEISDREVNAALKMLKETDYDGTLLGVSKYTGKPVCIADHDINQVMLVLGTTGGGKTVTLQRFYQRAITKGHPLIVVDGKPDVENINWITRLAKQYGRSFCGFNCGNYLPYDPLANGGHTELKDKIISLKDEWSSDHYRSIAEDYLQTTLEVLLKSVREFDLKTVVEYLNYDDLGTLVRELDDPHLKKRVAGLINYDRNDITGLQAHLNILIHSELGQYFEKNDTTFTLAEAIQENAVIYFALPALRFPSFSKVLGKLVINDLKAVIDRRQQQVPLFTVFDEFSVFAGEQVLNLVNMGRGKGVHAIFGTQGLGDLEKIDVTFKNQVLNCVNTLICHRLNDQDSAESIANWVGTQNTFTITAQLNIKEGDAGLGTVKRNKEFIVHPDEIKQGLGTGEAFYISKVGGFRWEKVMVKI